jgi:biopolymer transport protein ExbD
MAKMTPIEKRAARKSRNNTQLDMNLVSLIDVFTILIFFLLSNSTDVQNLPSPRAVKLPESTAEKSPKETLVVVVSGQEIVVEGRLVARVADVMADQGDLIPGLKDELDLLSKRQVVSAKNEGMNQAITIMGDREIPYQLLRKVMFTCARANFVDVSFAVRQKA